MSSTSSTLPLSAKAWKSISAGELGGVSHPGPSKVNPALRRGGEAVRNSPGNVNPYHPAVGGQ